jgi:hypothetical protein
MTEPAIHPVDDADLDRCAARLGGPDAGWTAERLSWCLRPPSGPGLVALGDAGAIALAVPDVATRAGAEAPILQLVARAGPEAIVWSLLDDLRAHAGDAVPVVAIGPDPELPALRHPTVLPTWITGPDPFVPLQRPVDEFGPDHDAFAARLPDGAWSLRRSAATWSWRYLREPASETAVMDLPGPGGVEGLIAIRDAPIRGVRSLEVLELRAVDRGAHYDLLKAARRLSWERGGLPIVLRGEVMSRRYAFTAGYLPSGPLSGRRRWGVFVAGELPGAWRAWGADA